MKTKQYICENCNNTVTDSHKFCQYCGSQFLHDMAVSTKLAYFIFEGITQEERDKLTEEVANDFELHINKKGYKDLEGFIKVINSATKKKVDIDSYMKEYAKRYKAMLKV